ncbi:MAG: 26S proteasome regulatory subunit, variant 2 [Marteilia pararefringens]
MNIFVQFATILQSHIKNDEDLEKFMKYFEIICTTELYGAEDARPDENMTVPMIYLRLVKVVLILKYFREHNRSVDYQTIKNLINQIRDSKKNINIIFPAFLQIKYFYALSLYYEYLGNFKEFYGTSLNLIQILLASKSSDDIFTRIEHVYFRKDLFNTICKNICLSVILSDELFSFGEILRNPTSTYLRETSDCWIVDLIDAFNCGNINACEGLIRESPKKDKEIGDLLHKSNKLLMEKVRMMALFNLSYNSHTKRLTFEEISNTCQVGVDQVELLVIKTSSHKLIHASMNQIENCVTITFVKPIVLTQSQIYDFANLLDKWSDSMQTTNKDYPELPALEVSG